MTFPPFYDYLVCLFFLTHMIEANDNKITSITKHFTVSHFYRIYNDRAGIYTLIILHKLNLFVKVAVTFIQRLRQYNDNFHLKVMKNTEVVQPDPTLIIINRISR